MIRTMRKRETLPDPWAWCHHVTAVRCVKCLEDIQQPAYEQVATFKGLHYHAACALEVAIDILYHPPTHRSTRSIQ